jgi:ribosomal protein L11 methylase PrmA
MELAQIKPTDCVADLGSGDGRLVIAAAEKGAARAIGYELDSFWFNVAEEKKRRSLNADKIEFIKKSFWDVDLSEYDVVFLYQGKHILKSLTAKLQKDLKPGSRVVSNSFQLPGWKYTTADRGVYLYIR